LAEAQGHSLEVKILEYWQ